jgi:hypothetical protein
MDIVGYMYVVQDPADTNKKVHCMQVHPTPRINAKCRFSNFKDPGFSNPTLLSILKAVNLLDDARLQ